MRLALPRPLFFCDRSADVWRMPGAYLARGSEILWAHDYRHAADRPDYELVCQLAGSIPR